MFAAARGYHRREDKPFWWGHFDRLNSPVDEWGDTAGVFLADGATVDADCHVPQGARKPQRWVRLTGSLAAGELTGEMFALYEPPTPAGRKTKKRPSRGGRRPFTLARVQGGQTPGPTFPLIVLKAP